MKPYEHVTSLFPLDGPSKIPARVEWIAILLILILALGLRITHLDSMEFKGDEAFNLMKARELARLEHFPLTSATSSTDIPEPPTFMYLLSLPILITDDAVFVTGAIAVLNTLAILLCYILVRRFISPRAALIAAALYAVNPWQVLFSRKIWTQNLLPFFVLLFLLLLYESVFREKPRLLIFALGALAITVQLHISAAFIIPFTIAFLIWQRRAVRTRDLVLGICFGTLTLLPYGLYLTTHTDQVLTVLNELGRKPFVLRSSGILLPLQLVTTEGFGDVSVFFSSYDKFIAGVFRLTPFDWLARLLLLGGCIIALLSRAAAARALAIYTLFGLAYIFLSNTQIFPHYYNALLPIFFILLSLPISICLYAENRALAGVSLALFGALFLIQLNFAFGFLSFISREDCIWGEYGPPYRVQVESVSSALSAMERDGTQVELEEIHERVNNCVNWDILATEYLFEKLRDEPHRSNEEGKR